MSSINQRLNNNLLQLELLEIKSHLPNYLEQVTTGKMSFSEALLALTTKELNYKHQAQVERTDYQGLFFPALNRWKHLILPSNQVSKNKRF